MKSIQDIASGDKVLYCDSDGDLLDATVEHTEHFSFSSFPILVLSVTDHRTNPVRFKTVRNVGCGMVPGTWRMKE